MRKRDPLPLLATFLLATPVLLGGCASTSVAPVGPGDDRGGVRWYDPQPLLVVTCENTDIAFVPDFGRGYAMKSRAIWAKNDVELEVSAGMLTKLNSKSDSTAFLTFLQNVAQEAIKGAEKLAALGAGGSSLPTPGIWKFDYDPTSGALTGLTQIFQADGACPGRASVAPLRDR